MEPGDKDRLTNGEQRPAPELSRAELLARLVSTDWRERQEAVEALARATSGAERPELARAVLDLVRRQHSNLSVLGGALQALARIGQPLIDDLAALLQGPDRELRIYVPLALGQLGGPEAVRALVAAARDAGQPENVRFNAIEALGSLRAVGVEAEAADVLRRILREDPPYLRYAAVTALGQIAQPAADDLTDELLPLLADAYLAEPAVTALAQVSSPGSAVRVARAVADWLETQPASPLLAVSALALLERRCPECGVPAAFLGALKERGTQRLLALVDTACGDCPPEDPFWADLAGVVSWLPGGTGRCELARLLVYPRARGLAEQALAAAPDGCLAELAETLRSATDEAAYAAARLLGACTVPSARPDAAAALLEVLDSEDDLLAALAAEGLGRLGATEAIPLLLEQLARPAAQVRREAAAALASLPQPMLAEQVAALTASDNPYQRAAALSLLAQIDPARSIDAVLAALEDESFEVRREAVELLPGLADPRALAALQDALRDLDANLRRAAAQGCAALPPDQALPLLESVAQDENGWVRMHAVRGLGLHARPETLPALFASLDDPLPPVRAAAVQALAGLDARGFTPAQQAALRDHLLRMTQDPDEEVRRLASAYHAEKGGTY